MNTKALTRTIALIAALASATQVRAQGDLDILLRSVPPVVMIQFDTSGSMSNIVLPTKYLDDRGTGSPSNWFNVPIDGLGTPARLAAQVVSGPAPGSNWNSAGTGAYNTSGIVSTGIENYQRTCQIFSGRATSSGSLCAPGSGSCQDDDADGSSVQGTALAPPWGPSPLNAVPTGARIRCWDMPGASAGLCPAGVPAALQPYCSTIVRPRLQGSSCGTTCASALQPYTTIILPNLSFGATTSNPTTNPLSTTDYPENYVWWMLNEIYLSNVPVPFIAQDRLTAAKQAVTSLINQMNVTGQSEKVKFGLARYDSGGQGGYVVVPAGLGNKAALLAAINNSNTANPHGMTSNGGTPLSETLVDVGRYLSGGSALGSSPQGLGPSTTPYPVYSRNMTTGGTTGTIPPSPVTSECEKIFIIVVTDGLPTSDTHGHSGTAFTDTIGPYGDADGDFTDDVAAMLLDTDLRPGIPGIQNAVTYTVGFALDTPLLQDAADRGDGEYYSSSDATALGNALATAVTDILLRNTTLTAANVPANRTAFGNGFYTAYFEPGGRRSMWPGHLQAFTVNAALQVVDDANQPAIDPVTDLFKEPRNPHWDLGETLLADFAARTIYTTKASARADFTPAGITAADLGVLLSEEPQFPQDPNQPDFTDVEDLADSIVNFLHGFDAFDEDDDGSFTDGRPFVLGDIFHSNPIAIGPALNFLRFEAGYGPVSDINSFMGIHKHRDRIMYVGANDGMLHAVEAGNFVDPNPSVPGDEFYSTGDGDEVFGYVPSAVLPKLKQLAKLDTGKQYYVDGQSSAADVWIDYAPANGLKEGSDWTTVLLTPLREGGESVLALDVTDPGAISGNHGPYPRLMWEFTHANLGQTWSKPIVTRVKLRAAVGVGDRCGADNGDGDCIEEWVAIFGAGYRQEGDPNLSTYTNNPVSPTYTTKGRGVYMVRVRDGAILSSIAQDPISPTFSKMRYAIPAEPAVLDLNFDGFTDVVYIGDLGGQLWKWDLSTVGVPVSGVVPNTNWPAGVVFQAPVALTAGAVLHYHSIFQSAAAAFNEGDLWLSFASGERANLGYIGQTDPNDPNGLLGLFDDNNRFWVLRDETPTGVGAFPITLPIYEQPLLPATVPLPGHGSLTDVTNLAQDPNDLDAGYFFRVPDGEKFMTNHLIFGGVIYTASYKPEAGLTPPPGTCALGGTTSGWAFDLDDGAPGLVDPVVNQPVRTLTIGNGAPTDPRIALGDVILQTSTGEVKKIGDPEPLDLVDMIYWRQNF